LKRQLRYLLPRIVENDRQIEFINARAMPTGMERLLGAELITRGLEGWRVNSSDVVRITREIDEIRADHPVFLKQTGSPLNPVN
jgi:hypothetical protein